LPMSIELVDIVTPFETMGKKLFCNVFKW
jgi:hypothetical protein